MAEKFSGYGYIQSLARRLVSEFEEAGISGHPTLIGSARETPARAQLARLLPGDFGVGSGIVIDSFGQTSKQQDIVIYEKHLCPVFSINETPEATFYPIEGVMAVGEVKSNLDSTQLKDAVAKIKSVKSLERVLVPELDELSSVATIPFRRYGSKINISGTEAEQYSPDKPLDQVFGFILGGKSSLKAETLLKNAAREIESSRQDMAPNLIATLSDGYVAWIKAQGRSLRKSAMDADHLAFFPDHLESFPFLIELLRIYADAGRTVSTHHYQNYFRNPLVTGRSFSSTQAVKWEN